MNLEKTLEKSLPVFCAESKSTTPIFILRQYIKDCIGGHSLSVLTTDLDGPNRKEEIIQKYIMFMLCALDNAVKARDKWHDIKLDPIYQDKYKLKTASPMKSTAITYGNRCFRPKKPLIIKYEPTESGYWVFECLDLPGIKSSSRDRKEAADDFCKHFFEAWDLAQEKNEDLNPESIIIKKKLLSIVDKVEEMTIENGWLICENRSFHFKEPLYLHQYFDTVNSKHVCVRIPFLPGYSGYSDTEDDAEEHFYSLLKDTVNHLLYLNEKGLLIGGPWEYLWDDFVELVDEVTDDLSHKVTEQERLRMESALRELEETEEE